MILKFLKKNLKKQLTKYGYKLIKKNKSVYNAYETPSKELINAMKNCTGIIHFGAHRGDEAHIYNWFGKKVIWFEANPRIFESLKENISYFENQSAFNYLLLDKDNQKTGFYISSNDAASSSIYKFGNLSIDKNQKLWKSKNLTMEKKIKINSITFDRVIEINKIDVKEFNHWVVDIQGSELLFLKGAKNSLNHCQSIYIEVSQGDVYKDGAQFKEIEVLLKSDNFFATSKPEKLHCDVLFIKK